MKFCSIPYSFIHVLGYIGSLSYSLDFFFSPTFDISSASFFLIHWHCFVYSSLHTSIVLSLYSLECSGWRVLLDWFDVAFTIWTKFDVKYAWMVDIQCCCEFRQLEQLNPSLTSSLFFSHSLYGLSLFCPLSVLKSISF